MLSARNIDQGQIVFDEYRLIEEEYFKIEDKRTNISVGDVLLTIVGALGRSAVVPEGVPKFTLQRSVAVMRPRNSIDPYFLAYHFDSPDFQEWINDNAKGTAQKGMYLKALGQYEIPLPPLDEQRRIVARLDALLARSKRARAELAHVPGLLERQRQAVLARMSVDTNGDEWPRVQLGTLLLEGPTNGYSPPAGENSNGTLSLKLSATTKGYFDLSERTIKRLDEILPPSSKYWLRPDDILIQRANSLEYVGATAIYEGPEQAYIYPDLMMRIRVASPVVGRWIWRYLNSSEARQYFMNNATGTAGNMPKINGSTVRSISVPLPPLDRLEQRLQLVEAAFARIDRAAAEAERAAALLDRLDQATLARAFRGEL
jgi:type I restriction enzyme, S subunit